MWFTFSMSLTSIKNCVSLTRWKLFWGCGYWKIQIKKIKSVTVRRWKILNLLIVLRLGCRTFFFSNKNKILLFFLFLVYSNRELKFFLLLRDCFCWMLDVVVVVIGTDFFNVHMNIWYMDFFYLCSRRICIYRLAWYSYLIFNFKVKLNLFSWNYLKFQVSSRIF